MKDIVKRIVDKFAQSRFNDFDLLLDILFLKNPTAHGPQTVSKIQLKDFLMNDMKVDKLTDHELEIFFKTDQTLNKLFHFTREDLKKVLEEPFRKAIDDTVEQEANSTQRFGTQAVRDTVYQAQN
jgi:hypothetical protein